MEIENDHFTNHAIVYESAKILEMKIYRKIVATNENRQICWSYARILLRYSVIFHCIQRSISDNNPNAAKPKFQQEIIENQLIRFMDMYISMAQCKTVVTPLLTHRSYCSIALSHLYKFLSFLAVFTDSKVHGANMGPTWVLSAPDGPHVGPLNLAIRAATERL